MTHSEKRLRRHIAKHTGVPVDLLPSAGASGYRTLEAQRKLYVGKALPPGTSYHGGSGAQGLFQIPPPSPIAVSFKLEDNLSAALRNMGRSFKRVADSYARMATALGTALGGIQVGANRGRVWDQPPELLEAFKGWRDTIR